MRNRRRPGDHVELGPVLDAVVATDGQHHHRHQRVGDDRDEEDAPQVVVDDEDVLRRLATVAARQGDHVGGDDRTGDQGDEQAAGREQLLAGHGTVEQPAEGDERDHAEEHGRVRRGGVDEAPGVILECLRLNPVSVRLPGGRVVERDHEHGETAAERAGARLLEALPEQDEGRDQREAGEQVGDGVGTAEQAVQGVVNPGSEHVLSTPSRRWSSRRITRLEWGS